jgi:hypothetical protein
MNQKRLVADLEFILNLRKKAQSVKQLYHKNPANQEIPNPSNPTPNPPKATNPHHMNNTTNSDRTIIPSFIE